jgi:hypothetical protein
MNASIEARSPLKLKVDADYSTVTSVEQLLISTTRGKFFAAAQNNLLNPHFR